MQEWTIQSNHFIEVKYIVSISHGIDRIFSHLQSSQKDEMQEEERKTGIVKMTGGSVGFVGGKVHTKSIRA